GEGAGGVERALHEHGERQQQEQGDADEGAGEQRPLSGAARPVGGGGGVDEPQGALPAPYRPGVDGEDGADGDELHEGEHGGRGQVEHVGGLPVDLHFQGGEGGSAEDRDDAERGEGE